MNFTKLSLLAAVIFIIGFYSCTKDSTPITLDSNVTVTNTFQSEAMTGGEEKTIEELFQMTAGALTASAKVTDNIEFPAYLLGLYDINISEESITFDLVAKEDDATYSKFFRTIEAGTKDRYYFTFDKAQNVESATSNNSSVNLRKDSDKVLVVEIGEGFEFKPGSSFKITLK